MARRRSKATRQAAAPPPSTRDKRALAISAALILSVVIVYAQLTTHEFLDYDDNTYVTQNAHVSTGLTAQNVGWAFTAFRSANWHPVTWISHMLDVELFGMNAGRHLMTNVALHAISAVLLFWVLRRATRSTWRSAIVAALFALHPLHVESVAWVSERKDVLSAVFFMLTLLLYVLWVERRSTAIYIAMIVTFALGLMSKPMVITLPFVLLLLDWWPLQRLDDIKARVIEKLPLFALMIPSAILTVKAQQKALGSASIYERFANASVSYVSYLRKMIWPDDLAAIYPFPKSIPAGRALGAVVILIAITAAAIYFARRFRYLPTDWFWYLGTLLPVIGIIQVGRQSMADRYTYIPLIGIFMAIVWLGSEARYSAIAAAIAIAACGTRSYAQVAHWKNTVTLSEHALRVTRDNDVAHTLLGAALAKRGQHAEAEQHLRTAIQINGDNDEALKLLGRLKMAAGHPEEAIPLLDRAVTLRHDPPTEAALAAARGDNDTAIRLYQQAIAEGEEVVDAENDSAALLAKMGRDQDALAHYENAIRLMPNHYDARMNLGALLSRMGRDNDAIEQFEAAARARPDSSEPHVYLALVHANRGQLAAAINEVSTALAVDPAGSNREFTNAVRIPFKETNLRDYLAFLQRKARG
jgi:tetratricopeptide (TPR) repeat protein